ncbi:MAG TPA: hypothetical protein V6C85_34890 [Allocoleopsis sp.]
MTRVKANRSGLALAFLPLDDMLVGSVSSTLQPTRFLASDDGLANS